MQRRKHARYHIWFPVQVRSGDLENAMAFNHNIGAGGMLIALSAQLKVEEKIEVTFHLPPDGVEELKLTGIIRRIEKNPQDPDGLWPYRIAVQFDEVMEELVPLLEVSAARTSEIP